MIGIIDVDQLSRTSASPVTEPDAAPVLLSVSALRVGFDSTDGSRTIVAVDGVDLEVRQGRTLGLVGESGSGKSVTGLSILRLLPERGRLLGGTVRFGDRDLTRLPRADMEAVRGRQIAMIFQDPMSSLNPVKPVGWQIAEALHIHGGISMAAARARATELLRLVGISEAPTRARSYPHQLSGGMCQRVMVAMALACKPKLLIADEPTTALDVTIQAQILDLIRRLCREMGAAVILISHDLGVVAETADDVAVMYAGRIVETAPVTQLFAAPRHPYTQGLLHALPGLATRARRLPMIEGAVPEIQDYPLGCRFAPRCPRASEICTAVVPALTADANDAKVACHHPLRSAVP